MTSTNENVASISSCCRKLHLDLPFPPARFGVDSANFRGFSRFIRVSWPAVEET